MEGARPVTKYEANFKFGSDIGIDEAAEWFNILKSSLPEGTESSLSSEPLVIEVENVTDAYIGHKIRAYIDKDTGTVEGTLDKVYPAGRHRLARALVIDGVVYTVLFGSVQVVDW